MNTKILIPLYHDEVAPRFDLASEVLFITLDAEKNELERSSILLAHPSAEDLCRMALDEKVHIVICNGIEEEFWQYLRWKRINVFDKVMGSIDAIMEQLRRNKLASGDILFTRGTHV